LKEQRWFDSNHAIASCHAITVGEEDRYLHVALPVAAFLEMLAKSVITRATTTTRA